MDRVKTVTELAETFQQCMTAIVAGDIDRAVDCYATQNADLMFFIATDYYLSLIQAMAMMYNVTDTDIWQLIASHSTLAIMELGAQNGGDT